MSMSAKPLIIAEKPSAARAIADALGGFAACEGYLESPQYLLSWAIGHLVEQMAPEEYDPRWKRWSLEALPMLPAAFGVKVVPRTRAQFETVARLARTASELINACDAGREGELIFRYICQAAGIRRPTRRLWVSSLTREAIRKAFGSLRPQAEYDRLYQSALCRAQGDWLVGMNATRAFTVKWGELLSVGRVQTPTLALIVRREREIEAFEPHPYWEVWAEFATADRRTYGGKYMGPDGDRLTRAEDAQVVADRVKGQPGSVESVDERPVVERPPQLYDLTTLQREANRRFGLTAAATLKAAQSLYEDKLITYPRTDSRYLTRDLLPSLPAIVKAVDGQSEFRVLAQGADLTLVHGGNRRVIDDGKVSDHHAIIPTTERPGALSGAAAKIYGLVVRRFLAQFYADARYLDVEVITRVGAHPDRFRSHGRQVLVPGWRVVEEESAGRKPEEADEEQLAPLPPLAVGDAVLTRSVDIRAKTTKPPRRYSEAGLLSAMEFAGKEITDEALKEAMKGHGLGTPATRAAIIERLKGVGYVVPEKKALVPTPKGRELVQRAESAGAQVLLNAELTGDWEKRIADIQAGSYEPERLMGQIRDLAAQVVQWVRQAEGGAAPKRQLRTARSGSESSGESELPAFAAKCPRCGRAVVKGSKGWLCANADCALRVPGFLCGKVIDAALATALLQKGKTSLITGFTSPRTGKTFSAFLVLKEGKVAFEFPTSAPRKTSGYRRSGSATATAAADKPVGKRRSRSSVEVSASERTAAAKTGSRTTGGRTSGGTGTRPGRAGGTAGARVGRRAPRASESAGGRPE